MDDRPTATGPSPCRLTLIGLGPGTLERLPGLHRSLLLDPERALIVRTIHHPAAGELAALRPLIACDDLYEVGEKFSDVYDAIAERVLGHADTGPTVYAVPGSPLVGEFAVRAILQRKPEAEVIPSESFLDAVLRTVGYDPLERGLRLINGHELPQPLALDGPTIIGHLDAPVVLADVVSLVSRALPEGAAVTMCVNLGADDERVLTVPVDEVPTDLAGYRTSMFIDSEPAGLVGAAHVSRRLREECPWDRAQTHASLVAHLMEETAELAEALAGLPDDDAQVDWVAYDAVEEELGDVLLQVLFHATIAAERGAFTVDDVATRLREKLVRRHPHVFGDVQVSGADEVAGNWERIKQDEKGTAGSVMDDVPAGMPALERAAKLQRRAARVGFDWARAEDVLDVLAGEVDELRTALADGGDVAHELGDIVFTAVNLARRLELSPEVVTRRAAGRFEERFRRMEAMGPLEGLGIEALEERWQAVKRQTT